MTSLSPADGRHGLPVSKRAEEAVSSVKVKSPKPSPAMNRTPCQRARAATCSAVRTHGCDLNTLIRLCGMPRRRQMPTHGSRPVRFVPLWRLQSIQARARLSRSSLPPWARGMMCSICSAASGESSWRNWQYSQRLPALPRTPSPARAPSSRDSSATVPRLVAAPAAAARPRICSRGRSPHIPPALTQ